MKLFYTSVILVLALLLNAGCRGKESSGQNPGKRNDNTSVPDTGFTGIKQAMSGGHIAMETTYKNGVKDGITKTFYASGKLRGTLMYENGLRVDSAKWYFEEGQLFRTTPYKRDTVDGIQKQYFRNGKLKALIGYSKGLRTFDFQEFDMEGRRIGGYPDIKVNIKDDYNSKGTCTISLALSDKSTKVRFYRGDFGNGLFDSTRAVKIKTVNGIGTLELKKSAAAQSSNIEVIAAIITFYGNSYLLPKKIELPYKDLN
jgi:hypothetical protein